MELLIDRMESSLEPITLAIAGGALRALDFGARGEDIARGHGATADGPTGPTGTAARMRDQADPAGVTSRLRAYLDGDLAALADIEVAPRGTPFQRSVWAALSRIAPGATLSYGRLAAALGRPGSARAVGAANARNPIAIVIPCHRVIGAGGIESRRARRAGSRCRRGASSRRWRRASAPSRGLACGGCDRR